MYREMWCPNALSVNCSDSCDCSHEAFSFRLVMIGYHKLNALELYSSLSCVPLVCFSGILVLKIIFSRGVNPPLTHYAQTMKTRAVVSQHYINTWDNFLAHRMSTHPFGSLCSQSIITRCSKYGLRLSSHYASNHESSIFYKHERQLLRSLCPIILAHCVCSSRSSRPVHEMRLVGTYSRLTARVLYSAHWDCSILIRDI